MPFLRQSTSQVIRFGPCLDKTDGVTEETGLTLAQADMRLSKDGGAFAQKSAAGNAAHDSDGWYSTTLSTTDTATVGELRLNVHQPANMLPVWDRWWVIEEAVYDAMYGASATGPLQPTTAGRTLDIEAGGTAGIDWGNVANKTTANALSGTDIQTVTVLAARIPAALVGGRMDSTVDATGMESGAVDNIWAKAMTELGAVPGVTGTALAALEWLFLLSRNKGFQTSPAPTGEKTLRNDADDADIAKSVITDDGSTFTRNKYT